MRCSARRQVTCTPTSTRRIRSVDSTASPRGGTQTKLMPDPYRVRSPFERRELLAKALGLPEGSTPFPWQARLLERFCRHDEIGLPTRLDIPTGLGKTSVIAIWLLGRALGGVGLPRRLVYVVDRRAVVDQASAVAEELRTWLEGTHEVRAMLGLGERPLPISTLRGQHVDNREWLEDPSLPAIVVGTVDMVGSRLLFGGYGVSRRMRPYHAGLLGQDTLIVLDEAHLVPPFEALIGAIARREGHLSGQRGSELPAVRLLSLSATGRENSGEVFKLGDDDREHAVVRQRLDATKRVHVEDIEPDTKLPGVLAEAAWALGALEGAPQRVVVFVTSRKDAQAVFGDLVRRARPPKRNDSPSGEVELLVGQRRVRDRAQARKRLEKLGFLGGALQRPEVPVFLVATAAGEVGVDLDADHMVSDLVAWERMVQRLGRVNRRGEGKAEVRIYAQPPKKKEDLLVYEARREMLRRLEAAGGKAGPSALAKLNAQAAQEPALKRTQALATTAAPLRPPLEAATVLDWAMTSWEGHAGRADLAPWLRGWVEDDEPRCRLVWRVRKHLPFVSAGDEWRPAGERELRAYFEAAPPHLSEVLETEAWRAVEWLADRAKRLLRAHGQEGVLGLGDRLGFLLDASNGHEETLPSLVELSEGIRSKRYRESFARRLVGRTLVLDHRVAGLDEGGLLDGTADTPPRTVSDEDRDVPWLEPLEVRGFGLVPAVRFRIALKSAADRSVGLDPGWRERIELPVAVSQEGDQVEWSLVVEQFRHFAEGEEARSAGRPQSLAEHSEWTATRARALAERLGLPDSDTRLLALAGRLHDLGKQAERWQRAFSAPRDQWPLAKTLGPVRPKFLDGYRHEFGSLPHAEADAEFQTLHLDEQDLVLHLIAAHHGLARPLISTAGCDDLPPSVLAARARAVAQRFFRLQTRWGPWGLAWWEAVLRAADQQASRANDEADTRVLQEAR